MTELRKVARLAGITSDKLLLRAFVVGLPSVVSRELGATANIENLALSAVVERARALMLRVDGATLCRSGCKAVCW